MTGRPLCNLKFQICNLLLLAVLLPSASAAETRKTVIPFDFVSTFDEGRLGRTIGDMVWKKLSRGGRFIVPESMLDVRDYCQEHRLNPSPATDLAEMKKAVQDGFGGQIGIWGRIEPARPGEGEVYDLVINCFDFSTPRPRVIFQIKTRTRSAGEIPHLYVKQLVDALEGRGPEKLPAADPVAEENWKKNPNLVKGDFEHGADGVPDGWDRVAGQLREPLGGLVRWADEIGNPRNRVIRFTLDQNVAESEGVMYYSDWFRVEEGAKYRFQCRWRSDGPAAKVFVKCYDEVSESLARREVYRSQQNLKGPVGAWNTQTEDFTPRRSAKYSPQWGRVMLYAYLKPGTVEFDDVIVKQIAVGPDRSPKIRRPSSETQATGNEAEANKRRSRGAKEDEKP